MTAGVGSLYGLTDFGAGRALLLRLVHGGWDSSLCSKGTAGPDCCLPPGEFLGVVTRQTYAAA